MANIIFFWIALMGGYGLYLGLQDLRKLSARKKAQAVILNHAAKFVQVATPMEWENNLLLCLGLCLLIPTDDVLDVADLAQKDVEPSKETGETVFRALADTFDKDGKRWFKMTTEAQRRYADLKRLLPSESG